ncbi:MAG TPA: thioredoxin domain-containing protein [Terriglobales bacterium]|nr:thioredoxin domain-containing protein [Terriglobales bacterium]
MANRLATAASPYLRLHASNPVDWYPWGEAAFQRARELDRPIFLSIGYFTCHWCHVMERESFADVACAELLNRDFVAIKVDREERPDVDRLYMAFVQATSGGGGWPLSAFLTPERQPFYGGTYFPSQDRHGLPSFARLLQTIAQAWKEQRPRLLASAAEMGQYLARELQPAPAGEATPALLLDKVWPRLFEELRAGYDAGAGGFGGAPKFPRPVAHAFLLRYARRHGGSEAATAATAMVVETLRAMARGGVHDHLGGGFHRYATDAGWRVPHFEKMLYDQAQLVVSYLEAWQLTQAPDLAETARTTCNFVLREMQAPGGGFYSAQDADSPIPLQHRQPGGPSEGEGAYYLWTKAEIETLLPPDMAWLLCLHYGVREGGNVPLRLDPQGEFEGKNILYVAQPIEAGEAELLAEARTWLYNARRLRPRPPTDDKVLTAWNGLMISALAQAGAALEEPGYLAAAQATARFLLQQRWDKEAQRLLRTATVDGFAEDYAFLIQGLLDLHQADLDGTWLEWADRLQRRQEDLFAAPGGGYYSTAAGSELWLRLREDYDGAEPSPNSVAVSNLLRLELWFAAAGYRERAERTLASFAARLQNMPQALPLLAALLETAAAPPRRLQIRGGATAEDTRALLRVARRHFLPGTWVVLEPTSTAGPAAAYLCEDYTCQLPITEPAALAAALG